jgi:hypothetical protein
MTKYKTSPRVVIRDMDAKILIMSTGDIIEANESTIAILRLLEKSPLTPQELTKTLLNTPSIDVSVSEDTVKTWVTNFVKQAETLQLIIQSD